MQEALRLQTEIPKANRIGQARFRRRNRVANPKHRFVASRYIFLPFSETRGKCQGKTRSSTGIAKRKRTDLGHRIAWNPTFKCLIKNGYAGRKRRPLL